MLLVLHVLYFFHAFHAYFGILRYSINNTKHNVPVKDDLKYLQDYLVIQSTRFGANFSYEIDIDDACAKYMPILPS